MNTTDALRASYEALQSGMIVPILQASLVIEGFAPAKAATIIRWAKQSIKLTEAQQPKKKASRPRRKTSQEKL